jgi:hypothetical protein
MRPCGGGNSARPVHSRSTSAVSSPASGTPRAGPEAAALNRYGIRATDRRSPSLSVTSTTVPRPATAGAVRTSPPCRMSAQATLAVSRSRLSPSRSAWPAVHPAMTCARARSFSSSGRPGTGSSTPKQSFSWRHRYRRSAETRIGPPGAGHTSPRVDQTG